MKKLMVMSWVFGLMTMLNVHAVEDKVLLLKDFTFATLPLNKSLYIGMGRSVYVVHDETTKGQYVVESWDGHSETKTSFVTREEAVKAAFACSPMMPQSPVGDMKKASQSADETWKVRFEGWLKKLRNWW